MAHKWKSSSWGSSWKGSWGSYYGGSSWGTYNRWWKGSNALPEESVLDMDPSDRAWAYATKMSTINQGDGSHWNDLQKDIFWNTYQNLSPSESVPKTREVSQALMQKLLENPDYMAMAREANNNFFLAESTAAYIIQELMRDQNNLEAMAMQGQAKDDFVDADEMDADAAQAARDGQPGKANQLTKMAKAKRAKAEKLLEEALKKIGKQKLGAARSNSEKMGNMLSSWGFDHSPSDPKKQGVTQLLMKTVNNHAGRKIGELAGRIAGIGIKARRGNKGFEPFDVTLTQNMDDIFPDEIDALLGHYGRIERLDAINRYVTEGLMGIEYDHQKQQGNGPFICAVDESGSMDGVKDENAKGIAVGLAKLANRESRKFKIVGFSDRVNKKHSITDESTTAEQLVWASEQDGGGTSFTAVLEWFVDTLQSYQDDADFEGADALMITDGSSSIEANTAKQWLKLSSDLGVKLHILVLVDNIKDKDYQKAMNNLFSIVKPASLMFTSTAFKPEDVTEIVSVLSVSMY